MRSVHLRLPEKIQTSRLDSIVFDFKIHKHPTTEPEQDKQPDDMCPQDADRLHLDVFISKELKNRREDGESRCGLRADGRQNRQESDPQLFQIWIFTM